MNDGRLRGALREDIANQRNAAEAAAAVNRRYLERMDEPSWWSLLAAATLVLLGVLLVARLSDDAGGRRTTAGSGEPRRSRPPRHGPDAGRTRRAAVVVNPSKFTDVGAIKARVTKHCLDAGWEEPLWLETSVKDPGTGQAREALTAGVEVICALGGDGTVRTVASELIGTGVPLGLLPAGTGNLLARNLELPIDTIENALTVALGGRNSRIDTCTLTLLRPTEQEERDRDEPSDDDGEGPVGGGTTGEVGQQERHHFVVMAGLGFDAEVMADVPEKLKSKVGWAAYIVSGAQHLRGPQFRVDVSTDSGLMLRRRVRSVLVGNVGKLQGGVLLLPDAKFDDGIVDMVLLSPDGVVGWGAVAARLVTRQRRGHHRVDHHTAQRIRVRTRRPVAIQLDGDSLGTAMGMTIEVDPASLIVRTQT